ncbi:histidinol-phosphate transaminase [Formosa algae]|uniref:Histidinol-phosphate aminotransferase n=1 Tax=Formosa algae TaxID=225843 RepID=A0A9X1CC97_9FLAO|nr:histidinol-phosphate transaminase [Formosa algae]MBP1840887.1 histidinol-phosphate aminotransferase [Formosa algae]MDQ0336216.1 histidinol-phosphate aminotransferase [Formosa algae]OEI79988.1 histidinol-phosphate transaminase [Formosa algae]PNW28328.1 histidinol-phosphate transaminase [Formosa algae]
MATVQDLLRPSIKALKAYSSARDEFQEETSNMVFLDANENPFENGINRYPDPHQNAVKDILADIKGVSKSQILLGNGSDEVLDLLVRAFCEPNQDNIIILPPTYGMYEVLANLNAVAIKKVLLSESFQPEVDQILNVADAHSKILFLCSPNNPSGNSFNDNEVETLLKKFEGIVVIDEAYIDFSTQDSWLHRLEEFPNLVITQTLSKAYGMAGLRLGICYASETIISVLNTIKPPYNINVLTQNKAVELLKQTEVVSDEIDSILIERSKLLSELKSIAYIEKIYPSDTNFVLVKVDDATARYNQLIQEGIVIRNRTTQPLCENCLRLTVGTPSENKTLITALTKLK